MSFESRFLEGWGTASFEGLFTDHFWSPVGGDGSPVPAHRVKLVPGINGVFLMASQKCTRLEPTLSAQQLAALVKDQAMTAKGQNKTLAAASKTYTLDPSE